VIYELSRDIEERLRVRKFPLKVHYGPEAVSREYHDPTIVMLRDLDADDTLRAPAGQQRNPRKFAVRELAALALVYAKSSLDGAHRGDHERLCEKLIDGLTTELEAWATEAKCDVLTLTGGRYVNPAELELEKWNGVVYALRFRVPRGVSALTYEGEARPTGAATAVQNQTQARMIGAEDEAPEIGCGA
jgi:hypothetical protein